MHIDESLPGLSEAEEMSIQFPRPRVPSHIVVDDEQIEGLMCFCLGVLIEYFDQGFDEIIIIKLYCFDGLVLGQGYVLQQIVFQGVYQEGIAFLNLSCDH